MMRVSAVEHTPVKVLSDYFERAVEELGLRAWASLLRPGRENEFQEIVKGEVYRFLFPQWREEREKILQKPDDYLSWEPTKRPEAQIKAHYVLQAAIVAILMGDQQEVRTLAAQLIVEHMNRKLEISHFLGNLTNGKVGSTYPELPTKSQVLQWVRDIDQIKSTYRLDEIARIKYE